MNPGEKTYVDAIIEQSSAYAGKNGLKFTNDLGELRKDLLTHGDGQGKHPSIHFIDKDTRDSINAWAASDQGKQWIHQNVDYPQTKSITEKAVAMVDTYGKNIPAEHRLETIAILAKTENQIPGKVAGYEKILKDGGNYDDVLKHANDLRAAVPFYDGPKAAAIAAKYQEDYASPGKKEVLDRAQAKVGSSTYDPSKEASDPDIKEALKAIGESHTRAAGHGVLKEGAHSEAVKTLQTELSKLGYTDDKGNPLKPDGRFGPGTKAAVEAFQHDHKLKEDGVAGKNTQDAIHKEVQSKEPGQAKPAPTTTSPRLDDPKNPDNAMYKQSLDAVNKLEARMGRTPDQYSEQLAASLVVAAKRDGLTKIDQVVLSKDGSQAMAVQGDVDSSTRKIAPVQTAQAANTPIEQSSTQAQAVAKPAEPAPVAPQVNPQQAQTQAAPVPAGR